MEPINKVPNSFNLKNFQLSLLLLNSRLKRLLSNTVIKLAHIYNLDSIDTFHALEYHSISYYFYCLNLKIG